MGIAAGDRLSVEITEDAIVLRRRAEKASERLHQLGAIGSIWKGVDPVAYVRELRDEMER